MMVVAIRFGPVALMVPFFDAQKSHGNVLVGGLSEAGGWLNFL
jgi:hypothetical protein